MHLFPSFARAASRQLQLCALVLCAAAACPPSRAGTADGLAISGSPSHRATVGQTYSFTPKVSNPTKRPLRFVIENKPAWATFNTSTGQFSGTPTAAYAGAYYYGIEIIAQDGLAQAALLFPLQVSGGSKSPPPPPGADGLAISGSPSHSATVGQTYSFTPTVSNPTKRPLKFVIENKPTWATFNASTGQLSGTPPAAYAGVTYGLIEIIAQDGVAQAALLLSLKVSAASSSAAPPPGPDKLAISGSPPKSATVGQTYSFTPTVSNPTKRPLRFVIENKPAWATFNTSTGQFSGTPTAAYAGATYGLIEIIAQDGVAQAALLFALNVAGAATTNTDKPVLSGTPSTKVTAGGTYAFQPTAKDPAGKTLSFSVQNKPSWATFSIANGSLGGKPSSTQTGTYGGIVISASNGTNSTALPAFSITVTPATASANGQAMVTWTRPSTNTNGTALTDLAGFRLHYGTSPSSLGTVVQIPASSTTYTVSNLPAATWYFGMTAYTTTGLESAMSQIVSKSVN